MRLTYPIIKKVGDKMIKRIGYACINLHLKPRGFKECRLNSVYKYGIEYLRDKIINNIVLTKDILKWNIENEIFMYRVTSTLFPLVNHPDQFTVLNSLNEKVVKNSIVYLQYHYEVLKNLGGSDIIIHTGVIPKMHISSGKMGINDRRHSDYIKFEDFQNLTRIIEKIDVDLMVEAKKKDEAILRIKNCFL